MKNRNDISNLLAKAVVGNLDEQESKQLREWCEADCANRALLERVVEGERLDQAYDFFDREKTNRDWMRLYWRTLGLKQYIGYAAAILLPFVLGVIGVWMYGEKSEIDVADLFEPKDSQIVLSVDGEQIYILSSKDTTLSIAGVDVNVKGEHIYYAPNSNSKKSCYNTISIPKGKRYFLVLEDSSYVHLNAESKFKFPVCFDNQSRNVELLEGEAFFSVKRDSMRAFNVSVKEMKVSVLGTKFNVKAYENETHAYVTLSSGSVAVERLDEKVILEPNQQYIINKESNKSEVHNVAARLYCSWVNGRLNYRNKSLEDIMTDLSRYFEMSIKYEDEALRKLQFSLAINEKDSFEKILKAIERTNKVSFSLDQNCVTVQSVEN